MTTAEEVAHELVASLGKLAGVTSIQPVDEPEEDMRSGGYFFEVEDERDPTGPRFVVLVQRVGA